MVAVNKQIFCNLRFVLIQFMKMKGVYISGLLAVALAWGACNKPTTVNNPIYNDPGKFAIAVDGLHDTTIERTGQANYVINVKKISGVTEKVAFSTYNAPAGMTVSFDTKTAEPSYTTIMHVVTDRTPTGVYPIRVTAASASLGIVEYKFTVTVSPYSNEATGFLGDFNETGNCTTAGGHKTQIEAVTGINNRINIKGFWHGTYSNEVVVDLNPTTNTLTVPTQVRNGLTYQGSGTYKDDELTVNYTVNDGSLVHDTCSSTFIRL